MAYNFQDSIKGSNPLEKYLAEIHPSIFTQSDGRKSDFKVLGLTAEAKLEARKLREVPGITVVKESDFHKKMIPLIKSNTMKRNTGLSTSKFYIEEYKTEERKRGGPWQALENGAELYFHWFIQNRNMFFFRTKPFCKWLDDNKLRFIEGLSEGQRKIDNSSYSSVGLLLPLEEITWKPTKTDWVDTSGNEWKVYFAQFDT